MKNFQTKTGMMTLGDLTDTVKNFENHPTIIHVKESFSENVKFTFPDATRD